jgi:esterase
VDMSPRAYPPDHNKIFAALLALDLKKFQSRREMEDALAPDIPDLTLRRFLLKNLRSHASPSGAQTFGWKINLSGLFKNYPNLLEPLSPQAPFLKPSLFLYGGQSNYVSENDVPLVHKFFPQAKMEVIPQAHHWIHTDAPEEFVRRISAFLSANSQ